MRCSDWIQVGLSAITLAGVAIALLQPIFQRRNDRTAREKTAAAKQQSKIDRIRKVVSLYLDVLEVKAEVDKNVFRKAGDSLVSKGKFEDYNQKNYDALELTFLGACRSETAPEAPTEGPRRGIFRPIGLVVGREVAGLARRLFG